MNDAAHTTTQLLQCVLNVAAVSQNNKKQKSSPLLTMLSSTSGHVKWHFLLHIALAACQWRKKKLECSIVSFCRFLETPFRDTHGTCWNKCGAFQGRYSQRNLWKPHVRTYVLVQFLLYFPNFLSMHLCPFCMVAPVAMPRLSCLSHLASASDNFFPLGELMVTSASGHYGNLYFKLPLNQRSQNQRSHLGPYPRGWRVPFDVGLKNSSLKGPNSGVYINAKSSASYHISSKHIVFM